jgi:outer membrane protein W
MPKQFIYLFIFFLCTKTVHAQHLQLIENRGELGVFAGQASYNGDLAPSLQFLSTNFGVFYKRQLNDYVGLRLNYEIVPLGAFDLLTGDSINSRLRGRDLYFKTTYQDISLMTELYFLKFIYGNKKYRFSPYLGFGVGYSSPIKDASNYKNLAGEYTQAPNIITMPLNIGFKYNVVGSFNLFSELTYRFTNSDELDHFGDKDSHLNGGLNYQASTSGKDQFFSAKLGLSYNLMKIYGPDPRPKAKRDNLFSKISNKGTKKSLFGFFKRK